MKQLPSEQFDLTNCDKELIHIPSNIQPHGLLLTLHPEHLTLLQASENLLTLVGRPSEALVGETLEMLFPALGSMLETTLRSRSLSPIPSYVETVRLASISYNVITHYYDRVIFVEFEQAKNDEKLMFATLYPAVHSFTSQLQTLATLEQVYQLTASEVQRITQYGRVLIYRFDEDWNGKVVAEARAGEQFPSLANHHFPAFDIPKQARELYRLNRLRIIPDANYTPVPLTPLLNPETHKPLDMTYSALRSVSPIHIEYMKNMETLGSMSISIIVEDKLWGLIACHNREPRHVPFELRSACDFISHFLSLQISTKEYAQDYKHYVSLRSLNSKLLAAMTDETEFTLALERHSSAVLALTNATGAAVITETGCTLMGLTPGEDEVMKLCQWLSKHQTCELFHTHSLCAVYPEAKAYKDQAAGLLSVKISKLHASYILWFRPELLQTVEWSGEPAKYHAHNNVIHPRKSFETWQEIVRLKSTPWRVSELDAAKEFRNSVVGIVLRKAEVLATLNAELARTNHELEAFSNSVSHDLRAPFRHIVGYSELIKEMEGEHLSERGMRYLDNVIESGQFAGRLVDNLLHFSHIGRLPIDPVDINMNKLMEEVRRDVMTDASGRNIAWTISTLPAVRGDLLLIRVVLRNLLANAVKYTRNREHAQIEIGFRDEEKEYVFFVRDNGTGFEMQYVDKLFGVFQRLHKMEEFEGTGIGLANVKRIIQRQGGRVWAEGEQDKGATFYFTMPKP